MFHAMLALHREYVPFSTTSIANSKASIVHMPILVVEGIQFNSVDLLLCGLGTCGQFYLFTRAGKLSLFVICKSNMLLHRLWEIVKFMIALNFLVLVSNNFVECILVQPKVSLSFSCKQPKNQENVLNLVYLFWHVLWMLQ